MHTSTGLSQSSKLAWTAMKFGALAIFLGVISCSSQSSESPAYKMEASNERVAPQAKSELLDDISFGTSRVPTSDDNPAGFFFQDISGAEESDGMVENSSAGPREARRMDGSRSGREREAREPRAEEKSEEGGLELESLAPAKSKDSKKSATKAVKTWKPASAEANAARLSVGHQDDLDSNGMQISVAIDGWRARVVIDAYYLNPRERQLEGTFKLRLPDGASPYYFAFGQTVFGERGDNPKADPDMMPVYFKLDEQGEMQMDPYEIGEMRARTWEKVRESKMVPKEKAAHAYIETTRRRIDPALMEWNGAGIFSARVFPLMPKQMHRIVIGYDVDLTQAGDDLVAKIGVPAGLPTSRVDVGIHSSLKEVKRSSSLAPTDETKDTALAKGGREFMSWQNPAAGEIEVRFENPGTISMNGQQEGKGHYRATRIKLDLDEGKQAAAKSHATFLLDTSYSTDPAKFNVWLSLMKETLAKNRDVLTHFNVLFFSVDQRWLNKTALVNNEENLSKLVAFCNTLSLEGATDLRSALTTAFKGPATRKKSAKQRYFLFSDGAATWGDANRDAMVKAAKSNAGMGLFAYRTGLSGSDTRMLNDLAVASGGAVFSVVGQEEVTAAAEGFRAQPWKIKSVSHILGRNEMIEGRPTHVYPGQTLKVVADAIEAKIVGKPRITIELERNGVAKTIVREFSQGISSHFAARVYGQVATGQLEDLSQLTENESKAYARHFRITGRTCSLLMLESEEDYARYNIKPENDQFVVSNTNPILTISKAEKQLGARRGSAKLAFKHWASKLESMPGVTFKMDAALALLVDRMDEASFAIATEKLNTTLNAKSDLSNAYLEMLKARKIDYKNIVIEAERRKDKASSADQIKALSTLIENRPGDHVLGRDVAAYAATEGFGGHAYHLLKRVRDARPWEPLTYHAMAKALRASGKHELAVVYYELALGGQWKSRYGEFTKILAFDYQDYIRDLTAAKDAKPSKILEGFLDGRGAKVAKIAGLTEADIVITLTWNTDSTDIDLHVKEPTKEICSYSNTLTKIGGTITNDVTQGYGPEMYTLKKAKAGKYRIAANFYGNNSNRASVATKIEIAIHRNFGTPQHRVQRRVIDLGTDEKMVEVAAINIKE